MKQKLILEIYKILGELIEPEDSYNENDEMGEFEEEELEEEEVPRVIELKFISF